MCAVSISGSDCKASRRRRFSDGGFFETLRPVVSPHGSSSESAAASGASSASSSSSPQPLLSHSHHVRRSALRPAVDPPSRAATLVEGLETVNPASSRRSCPPRGSSDSHRLTVGSQPPQPGQSYNRVAAAAAPPPDEARYMLRCSLSRASSLSSV